MAASRYDIKTWFEDGVKNKATHMIVVCDTFDHDDYPVYVSPDKNVREVFKEYDGKNMQRVMEVYDLQSPMEPQLDQVRAFNF